MSNDEKMRAKLGDKRYQVLREAVTEAPFSGSLLDNKEDGMYHCGYCGAPLFSSENKFDSGSGWPSFDRANLPGSVKIVEDNSHGMIRSEVKCVKCDSHLGHVFEDGPKETTGQRFCINSLALDFEEEKEKKKK